MREIRFRCWNKNTKKMTPSLLEVKDIELMQYTGLKDKNGKEIYEGDVCINLELPCSESFVCRYSNEFAMFEFWNEETETGLGCAAYDELEIIGNIYENPELIRRRLK